MPWVEMKRDMTLYKYADIYMLLHDMTEREINAVFARAIALGLENVCAYAILETAGLFDMENHPAVEMAWQTLANDKDMLYRVVSPRENKVYTYRTKDVTKRFFMDDRLRDLKEVKTEPPAARGLCTNY